MSRDIRADVVHRLREHDQIRPPIRRLTGKPARHFQIRCPILPGIHLCQADTELLTEFLPSTGKTPEDTCYDSLLVQRIYELLEDEPERTQSIVNMRLEGYSFYEIGTKHGISESSARVIDFRAKAKIRRQLEKEGFEHD